MARPLPRSAVAFGSAVGDVDKATRPARVNHLARWRDS